MKRLLGAMLAAGLVASLAGVAAADTVDLPDGTPLSIGIASPADGAAVEAGTDLTVTGTVSIGAPSTDTTIVYLLDTSGSMSTTAGIDCDGAGGNDSRLVCEQVAAQRVNDAAQASGRVVNAAVIGFSSTATVHTAPPLTDDPAAVEAAIAGLTAGGGTSFQSALDQAATLLAHPDAAPNKVVVMISDGEDGGSVSGALPALVKTYAISGAGCGSGSSSLSGVAALGLPGSACHVVTTANLPTLGDTIAGALIGSQVTSVGVTVNGGAAIPATTPSVPVDGPASVPFSATVPAGQLQTGPNTVCAVAGGSVPSGSGTASDCVTVVVSEPFDDVVDCSVVPASQCVVRTTDTGVADAVATGLNGFDKTLAIRVEESGPTDCGGQPCLTAFNVAFPDTGGSGAVVELVVVMTREFSTPPGHAAVFIDGEEITNQCGGKKEVLPCAKINRTSGGRTQYVVRFDGDPLPRFR